MAAAAAGAAACQTSADEPVGQQQAAIRGTSAVDDLSYASNTVQIELRDDRDTVVARGSGIRVTPTVILTANHVLTCARAALGEPCFYKEIFNKTTVRYSVDPLTVTADGFYSYTITPALPKGDSAAFGVSDTYRAVFRTTAVVGTIDEHRATDVGIIVLDAGDGPLANVESMKRFEQLYRRKVARPMLALPAASTPMFMAGWNNPSVLSQPRIATLLPFAPSVTTVPSGYAFLRTGTRLASDGLTVVASEPGDSGGPWYTNIAYPGGTVQAPFALVAGDNDLGATSEGVSLVAAPMQAWLASKLQVARTSGWRERHGGIAAGWIGEAEYDGACNTALDADCDHWLDTHDNCPNVPNVDQKDANDDGVGDVCPCPCDTFNKFQDKDGDGICAKTCDGRNEDNCARVGNPDQANCNAAFEQSTGASVLGDKCDSVPCPDSQADREVGDGATCQQATNAVGLLCTGRVVHNEIDVRGIAPRIDGEILRTEDPKNVVSILEATALQSRFCQAGGFPVVDCHAPAVLRDFQLLLAEAKGDPLKPWHRVTLNSQPRGIDFSMIFDDVTKQTFAWDYLADNTFWLATNYISPTTSGLCTSASSGAGTCLKGTFWTHSDSKTGDTDLSTPQVGRFFQKHGPELSNHIFDLAPDTAVFNVRYGGFWKRVFKWRTLRDPLYQTVVNDKRSWVVVRSTVDQTVALLSKDGTGIRLLDAAGNRVSGEGAPNLSNAMAARLRSNVVWASAVEAEGTGQYAAMDAVAIAADGTNVVDMATHKALAMGTQAEIAFPAWNERGASAKPAARSEFITFASSSAAGVFVVGGKLAATGLISKEAWFRGFGAGWGKLPVQSANVTAWVAGTYAPSLDSMLLVGARSSGVQVLYGYHMKTGQLSELAGWKNFGRVTSFAIDRDGTPLLVAQGPTVTKVGRIRSNGTNAALSFKSAAYKPSTGDILVDARSYSFVQGSANALGSLQTIANLEGTSGVFALEELYQ